MPTNPLVPVAPVAPVSALGQAPAATAPAAPRYTYTPPARPLQVSKEMLDYRGELIKQSVELAKAESAYRSGLMNTWSTRQVALAGMEAQLARALVGAETDFAMADAVAIGGRAQMLASYREKLKNMAGTTYYAPDMTAVEKFEKGVGDDAGQLANTVTNDAALLNTMEERAKQFTDPQAQQEALYKQFSDFVDQEAGMERRLNNLSTGVSKVSEKQRYDTVVELTNRFAGQVQQAFGGDPRFAPFVERYVSGVANKYAQSAQLTADIIKQGDDRHAEAAKDDEFVLKEIAGAVTASGLSPALKATLSNIVASGREALGGDPSALADMRNAVPTEAEFANAQERIDRELARMDGEGDPNIAARNRFIKAFNDRAGRGDAFLVWANAMGFRGRGAIDKAVNFGASYPAMVAEFADAVKADPTVVAPTGGYASAKSTLESLGQPVGAAKVYRMLNRPPVQTPAEVQEASPAAPGINSIPFLQAPGEKAPVIAPDSAPPATPMPEASPGPRNRVEGRPDGSLVAVHPDGSETILSHPTTPVSSNASVSPVPVTPGALPAPGASGAPVAAGIASRLAPATAAVAPSDTPGASEVAAGEIQWQPTDFASLVSKQKMDELRARMGLDMAVNAKLDAAGQSVLGGR